MTYLQRLEQISILYHLRAIGDRSPDDIKETKENIEQYATRVLRGTYIEKFKVILVFNPINNKNELKLQFDTTAEETAFMLKYG